MSNYKPIIALIALSVGLFGCKPTSKSFSYKDNIDKEFFSNTMALAGLNNTNVDSIKVYKAELLERLVEMDAVPEYRLINKESDQKYVRLADIKNKSFLYLFQLFPDKPGDTVFVYMATSFSAKGICTGLGPVYLGMQRRDRIQFKNILRVSKQKSKEKKAEPAKRNITGEIIQRYEINQKKDTTHLIFYNDQRFPAPADRIRPLNIEQIIRDEPNKIGGNKAVIFTTKKIFEDDKALVFVYESTIK